MGLAVKKLDNEISVADFRKMIVEAEENMKNAGSLVGDALDQVFPLKHSFGKGLYIREVTAPSTAMIITKIHKEDHPYFVMEGVCSVMTEEGVVKIEAPYHGITKAGTKRAVYVHEKTVWVTVHATDKTDLEEIEEEIIAKDFSEF